MFARGRQEGFGIKNKVQKIYPNARCRRETRAGINCCSIYLSDDDEKSNNPILIRGNAFRVWEDFYYKFCIDN